MIEKRPIKYIFCDEHDIFKKRTEYQFNTDDVNMIFDCLFDPDLLKKLRSPYRPFVKKSARLYKITDDHINCLIAKYDYFCNTLRGHLRLYNGTNIFTYLKTDDMFYDTGYKSKKEIQSIQSYYEKKGELKHGVD